MLAVVWLWIPFLVTVSSIPTSSASSGLEWYVRNATVYTAPTNIPAVEYGNSQASRTIYTVVSLFCLSLLTGMLGYRARQLERQCLKTLNPTRILVFLLYFLSILFVTSAAVVESGLGLSSPSICHSAIILCLAFYVGSKVTMYIFLVERTHALRAPYMYRRQDWIWLVGMLAIAAGFGSIAICGFLWPISDLSTHDGRCRIGLPLRVTIPLVSFDVFINTLLTGIFIYLLRPLLRFGGMSNEASSTGRFTKGIRRILSSAERGNSANTDPLNQKFFKSIEALLWKSFIGSVLIMAPTIGNLVALTKLHGRELGWLCLTICTFDVTWAVCVIHWLTGGSTEVDERALAMLAQPDSASNASNASTSRTVVSQ